MGRSSRIDIVCPTFDRSTAIRDTIDSVLAQTVEDWTLLVVSDGSTDDTDDVVRGYRDPRVRLLRVGPFGHPGGPRNAGVAAATAPFVAYIDHDDRWRPGHLAVLLDLLDAGAAFAATGCVRVGPDARELDRSACTDLLWHPELQTVNAMYEPSRVAHVRELATALGGWTTVPAGYEDWDLWFRAAGGGYDFTPSASRTAVLAVGPRTRRNGLRPPHAVVLDRVDSRVTAESVLAAVTAPEFRDRARAGYLDEMCAWYADLAGTDRYRVAPEVAMDTVESELRAYFTAQRKHCLLEEVTFAPVGEGCALLLPLWCVGAGHAREIGRILRQRFPGQFALLREVVDAVWAG